MAIRTDQDKLIQNIDTSVKKGYALNGFLQVTGTAATTADPGTYWAVQFITDCTLTTFTVTNSTTVAGVIYKAGTIVYGDITAITAGASETYNLYKN